jgi:ComF family protein
MKYGSRREYADFYGKQMAKHLGTFIKSTKAQAIIPVPLADKKKKQRGYNQAECLAEALSKITKIPVIDDLVVRVRDTAPQKQLDEQQRQNNLKKAFKIGRNDVKLNITIIIDDIYTTGSTIDAVACALSEVGVERIYYVALAIGKQ